MRVWGLFSVFLLGFVWGMAQAASAPTVINNSQRLPASVPGELVVGFAPGAAAVARAQAHAQAGAQVVRTMDAIAAQVVSVGADTETRALVAYRQNPNVRYAELNYLRPVIIPDEGSEPWPYQPGTTLDFFNEQWGLHNTGQAFSYDQVTGELGAIEGSIDADIDATEAWDITTGSPSEVIAVLDTGIDCDHPDLAGKCVEETNFGPSEYGTTDILGHGTHVAGIAAAITNNDHGVAGVGWSSSLASLKVCYEYQDPLYGVVGLCDSAASAQAMIHAADMGYAVVNMSYAGPSGSAAEADAARYASANGVVLVAAAANDYAPTRMYPAAFDEVIAVAATDWHDNLASFSNFGSDWVSLAAPGHTIFSTISEEYCGQIDCYAWLSGTSMASPVVAGAAALVRAHLGPTATNTDVRASLETGADETGALGQDFLAWTSNGRLNVRGALAYDGSASGASSVHIADLDGAATSGRPGRWAAEVTVTVHDDTAQLLTGAAVSGAWSDGASGDVSCTTDFSGTCSVATSELKQGIKSVTLTVTNVAYDGSTYDSAANQDPDGDSDGTTITITAP